MGSKFLSTLSKDSDTEPPTTTKGDLSGFSSTQARVPISTNNFSLLCDSSEALGLKWGASPTSVLTTAGDLLVASGANTLSRLARGADNYILKMNGTSLNWEAEPASSEAKVFFFYTDANRTETASNFFGCNVTKERSTDETRQSSEINTALTMTRHVVHLTANSKGSSQNYVFRDDGATVTDSTVAVSGSATGFFDSGAIDTDIATGSLICFGAEWTVSGSVDINGTTGEFK